MIRAAHARAAVVAGAVGLVVAIAAAAGPQSSLPATPGPAYFVRSLSNASERREARPDILDTPVLPGSIMKAVTLVAALESQVVDADTVRLCRRVTTVEGRRYVCAHPDLKRPLTASEALAYSCNDFFVSLAPRLPRTVLNDVRARVSLAPVSAQVNYAAALIGLDGPRVSPRVLLDVMTRLVGADPERPMSMAESTRRVLVNGLGGAARYGSASALGERGLTALAKTGTAPMPGGAWMGMVVALVPAEQPSRAIVVVAPGAAGLDAASIAADLLTGKGERPAPPTAPGPPVGRSADRSGGIQQVRVGSVAGGRVTVARVDLEDYIARVLAGEGEPRAPDAAQQALAITARTFALANLNRHRREGYDFCDTTHCQVVRASTAATRRAAAATAGRVLLHEGQPATVFYSALCGGTSEQASDVWPGAVDYVTAPQHDEACEDQPAWESEIRVDLIERALREAGHRGGRLRNLRVLARNESGRVARLQIDGFTPGEINGHDFRMAVGRIAGWQRMKSTAFDVRRVGAGYRFRGRGFGHGVGLCVIGAGRRAAAGRTADQILRFYFPTLQIAPVGTPAVATTQEPGTPTRTMPADPRGDVRIALPAGEEGERARLVDLVRQARDAIAAATGTPPPATLTVTVHPTVESFARATGQPWWVSGATEGTAIDLLPLVILRQRGQIERTIRHEVAHVLIDRLLAGRPMWVREGAALYFSAPEAAPDVEGRQSCPRDDEFLRPLSAGTHRAAYARAEACFRRAVLAGKPWRDVR